MSRSSVFRAVAHCFRTLSLVVCDLVRLAFFVAHSRSVLAAENLFLRKQLALFQERKVKPRRADDSARWMMATLSRMFQWRDALVNASGVPRKAILLRSDSNVSINSSVKMPRSSSNSVPSKVLMLMRSPTRNANAANRGTLTYASNDKSHSIIQKFLSVFRDARKPEPEPIRLLSAPTRGAVECALPATIADRRRLWQTRAQVAL